MDAKKNDERHAEAQMLAASNATLFFPVFAAGYSGGGVSKREWLAGLAMAGLMDPGFPGTVEETAAKAVEQADALIAALAQS